MCYTNLTRPQQHLTDAPENAQQSGTLYSISESTSERKRGGLSPAILVSLGRRIGAEPMKRNIHKSENEKSPHRGASAPQLTRP